MEGTLTSPLPIYYDLELPPAHARRKRWPLVIGTHGYEGNKESMMRIVQQITGEVMIAASLQGPYQFWIGGSAASRDHEQPAPAANQGIASSPAHPKASQVSRRVGFGWGTTYRGLESVKLHHHAMKTLIDTLVHDHRADPARVFLVAFSQSCSFNYRFAFSH